MAGEAGIYECLWHPERVGVVTASQLIEPLANALKAMREDPERFKKFDASNGWGTYAKFVPWLEHLLAACVRTPDAIVSVSI